MSGWIAFATALITGITALLTWLLSKPQQIKRLKAQEELLEKLLRIALAKHDTIAISLIERDLIRVRSKLSHLVGK